MKFSDSKGRIINVYQSNTQLPDETWLKDNIESKSKALIDLSLDKEFYACLNANYHTWYWPECRSAGLRVLDYCNERGVPVMTAERVYKFLRMKDEAAFTNISWADNMLTFVIRSSQKNPGGLTFLLPYKQGRLKIEDLSDNGYTLEFQQRSIKGRDYVMATVHPGENHNISAVYK